MKCPLLMYNYLPDESPTKGVHSDCIKEECAWWEPKIGKCSVLRMWIALQDIHEVLHDIAKALTLK